MKELESTFSQDTGRDDFALDQFNGIFSADTTFNIIRKIIAVNFFHCE